MDTAVAVVTVTAIATSVWGMVTAGATTGNIAFPEPPVLMPVEDGYPFVGRFYVSQVARAAHLISGQLDIAIQPEVFPEYFLGEILLHDFSKGKRSTTFLHLYPFAHSHGHVSAALVTLGSLDSAHPYGVPIGRISFVLPPGAAGIATKAKELKNLSGEMTLNGGGPYRIWFRRGSDDGESPISLPKAKQVGR